MNIRSRPDEHHRIQISDDEGNFLYLIVRGELEIAERLILIINHRSGGSACIEPTSFGDKP